jgi:ubiquinone/menaquinone biosynthesis C-methylase UbiE
MTAIQKLQYGVSQSMRVAWYAGHYLAAQRLAGPRTPPGEPDFVPAHPKPESGAVYGAMRALFERDLANIEAGLYAMPHDAAQNPLRLLSRSRRFFRDLPAVDARRLARGHSEVLDEARRGRYPRYYLQNFHYQTGGWLSRESARLYDTQVEILFSGSADAMRRQALVPLGEALAGRDQRRAKLLDVACGTGRLLSFVKDNYPRLPVTGLDLSAEYLAEAGETLARWSGVDLVEANAESIPFEAGEFDLLTSVFLFHELPPKIRPVVAAEMARVLKPGGTLVFVDSIQYGDVSDFDALLDAFPVNFHEPYYKTYAETDLAALFGAAGLVPVSEETAFLSKVVAFRKAA